MKFTIVIPARNEEANIENMVNLLLRNFSRQIEKLIIVNDCSTDSSKKVLEKLKNKNKKIVPIHRKSNPGVGNAIREGYMKVPANSEYVLSLDCDFTKNINDMKRMIKLSQKTNADVVLGSRYMKGGKLIGYPEFKKFANRSFHILARLLLNFKQIDVTNNFKLMKHDVAKKILPLLKSRGFSINAETGIYPILLGYEVLESPVSWINRDKTMGRSSFKVVKAGPGYVKVLKKAFIYKYFTPLKNYSLETEKKHFDDLVEKIGETNYGNLTHIAPIRFEKKARKIVKIIKKKKNPNLLDYGSGTGILTTQILKIDPTLKITGVDVSKAAIKKANLSHKKFKNVKFIVGNALELPFKDKKFDVIFGNSILHHLPFEKSMKEINRVLKDGGYIWFSEPNIVNPQIFLQKNIPFIKKMVGDSPDETAYDRWSIIDMLKKAGFEKIKVDPYEFLHPLTPKLVTKLCVDISNNLEKTPLVREFAGSLEITARKKILKR